MYSYRSVPCLLDEDIFTRRTNYNSFPHKKKCRGNHNHHGNHTHDHGYSTHRLAGVHEYPQTSRSTYLTDHEHHYENAHKSLIRPIAFKPVLAPQSRYAPPSHRAQLSPHPPPHENPPRIQTYGSNMRSNMSNSTLSPESAPDSRSYDAHVASPRVTFDPIKSTTQMSPDDGYVSQEYHSGSHSHSNSNTSHNGSMHGSHNGSHNSSIHNDSDRSMDRSMDQSVGFIANSLPRPMDRPESFNSSSVSKLSQRGESFVQTPSPSDSGVGELEAMLRDKDATIQHLRDTMERNETAILQVCAEKEQNWEMELRELHEEWERRWRHHQEKSFKMEQALLLQLFKLQQERKTLKLDVETVRTVTDKTEAQFVDCEKDLKQTKTKLEEVSWELAQKSGEIALLKSQLKDSKELASHKGNDILSIKTALKEAQHSSDEKDHDILTLEAQLKSFKEQLTNKSNDVTALKRDVVSVSQELAGVKKDLHGAKQHVDLKELQMEMKCKELERLQTEHKSCTKSSLKVSPVGAIINGVTPPITTTNPQDGVTSTDSNKAKQEVEGMRANFTKEREQWLDEKNKVIRYQKHLQLNYVQMYRKNKVLEAEVEQLTLELEKRDICLMEPVKETEESVC